MLDILAGVHQVIVSSKEMSLGEVRRLVRLNPCWSKQQQYNVYMACAEYKEQWCQ